MARRDLLQETRRVPFRNRRRIAQAPGSIFLAGVLLEGTASASPGDLDPTFGANGSVLTGFGHGEDIGSAMAVQADGKLVMAGFHDSEQSTVDAGDLLLVRYDTNDVLDPMPSGASYRVVRVR